MKKNNSIVVELDTWEVQWIFGSLQDDLHMRSHMSEEDRPKFDDLLKKLEKADKYFRTPKKKTRKPTKKQSPNQTSGWLEVIKRS